MCVTFLKKISDGSFDISLEAPKYLNRFVVNIVPWDPSVTSDGVITVSAVQVGRAFYYSPMTMNLGSTSISMIGSTLGSGNGFITFHFEVSGTTAQYSVYIEVY